MLKTNSKKAQENIRKEIMNTYTPDELENFINNYNSYNKENFRPVNSITDFIANYEGENWSYYQTMREILKECLEETIEEAEKYNNERVAQTFYYLFDKEILRLRDCEIKHFYIKSKPLRTYPQIIRRGQ